MLNFEFYNPTRIVFGKYTLDNLDKLIPAKANVLIVSYGIKEMSGLIDRVKTVLGDRKVLEFGGIEPNPHYETCVKAMELARNENIDYLVAVGGGSVIDATKFISLGSNYDGDPAELLQFDGAPLSSEVINKIKKIVPFGTVLTLAATGSEMNDGSVITYGKMKPLIQDENIFPRFSILDPTITFTVPKKQVANGLIDSFVHAAEQYITYPVDARIQDRMAEGIMQTLIEVGPTTVAEPENYDARANFVWCSTLALNRLIGAGVPQDWTAHLIGLELTVLFGIDHGPSVGIMLLPVMDVLREQKRAKLLQYAERVWHIESGSEDEKIDLAIQKTREFFESLGVKMRLSEYGIGADRAQDIVDLLKEHKYTAMSENGSVTLEVSRKIIEKAL
ncbi:MAG: iron-containing alcohol dehydrogenase [Syntrophomonadaceae bacterium]|nr:iron-containing alcohol dehydrogenase [Syntrophomonadaceae bacterium]